ncbi:MAG: pilin protein [Mitsuokella sp.]|uniref:pilin protein n=1 Tax=Mitsuokella sp. TaxID=2049034 RepID=UPI003F03C555
MLEIIKYLNARYLGEKAQGITEYALLLLFVVAVAVAVLFATDTGTSLQNGLTSAFKKVVNQLTSR